ncbi:MAG: hypothetical protein OHK0047_34370 [Leptolyngbyaceae cyanobacterium]|uniref:slr1659 superfamily regulator n=1 Tax=Leptodesmis sp. TaxID=3100501 RepID=UPI003D0B0F97
MEIKTQDYQIWYTEETSTITCQGRLRLAGLEEYQPIIQFLDDILNSQAPLLILDLAGLEFLNSSGINVFLKFVLKVRQQKTTKLTVLGSSKVPWQGKSLKNFQRLMPELKLEFKQ